MEVGGEVEAREGKEACSLKQGDQEAFDTSALDTLHPSVHSSRGFYSHSDYKRKKTARVSNRSLVLRS